ncbi:MAG: T9SS type A sorting domain-containing protein [Bacteroidales bacterium]|jgi:hypothetical protein
MKISVTVVLIFFCSIGFSQSYPDTSTVYYFINGFEEDSTLFYKYIYTYDKDGLLKQTYQNFYEFYIYNGVALTGESYAYYYYDDKKLLKEKIIINNKGDTLIKEFFTVVNENDLEYSFYRNNNSNCELDYHYYFYNVRSGKYQVFFNEVLQHLNQYDVPYYYNADSILFERYKDNYRKKITFNYLPDGRVLSCLQEDFKYNDKLFFELNYDSLQRCYQIDVTKIIPDSCSVKYLSYSMKFIDSLKKELMLVLTPNTCFQVVKRDLKDEYCYDSKNQLTALITTRSINNSEWESYVSTYYAYKQGDAIVENSINNLRIYPNPATTQLSIDYGDYIIKDVKIYDVTGRCIKQEEVNLNRISIDVSDLHRGIYFLKINTEKGSLTRKVHIIR